MNIDLLMATIAASFGAQEMTVENELGNPDRYRLARFVNRQGRRALTAMGASSAIVIAEVLIG